MSDRDRSIAVQFYSIDDVVRAYIEQGLPCFAIWHRKQPLFPLEPEDIDEGADKLTEFLEMLKNNGSSATYTLCIYKDVPEKGIMSNTPYRASFNFKLNNPEREQYGFGMQRQDPAIKILQDQVTALQLKNEQLELQLAEVEDGDEGEGMGQIGAFLNHPLVKLLTDRIVGNLVNATIPPPAEQQQRRPAVMNGINQQTDEQKLVEALEVLKTNDPQLIDHLYKLAVISQQDPAGFKMLLGMLDKM